jgi:hypothetical protein
VQIHPKNPPRVFTVGLAADIQMADAGDIHLAPNEQVSFVTEAGGRFDVARKAWGFYATPSVNARLKREGFKTALVENPQGRLYVMVVEATARAAFDDYCRLEGQTVLRWLDEHPDTAQA